VFHGIVEFEDAAVFFGSFSDENFLLVGGDHDFLIKRTSNM
jgi:hypothetical protein